MNHNKFFCIKSLRLLLNLYDDKIYVGLVIQVINDECVQAESDGYIYDLKCELGRKLVGSLLYVASFLVLCNYLCLLRSNPRS